jgi:hypothetical protein
LFTARKDARICLRPVVTVVFVAVVESPPPLVPLLLLLLPGTEGKSLGENDPFDPLPLPPPPLLLVGLFLLQLLILLLLFTKAELLAVAGLVRGER